MPVVSGPRSCLVAITYWPRAEPWAVAPEMTPRRFPPSFICLAPPSPARARISNRATLSDYRAVNIRSLARPSDFGLGRTRPLSNVICARGIRAVGARQTKVLRVISGNTWAIPVRPTFAVEPLCAASVRRRRYLRSPATVPAGRFRLRDKDTGWWPATALAGALESTPYLPDALYKS